MEKEWKNSGVSGVKELTKCRRDRTCLLHQFIAILPLDWCIHLSGDESEIGDDILQNIP